MDVGELYELHASDSTRFATVLVGSSDAADVVSDAMVGVLTSSVRDERGYLFRAVANAANCDIAAEVDAHGHTLAELHEVQSRGSGTTEVARVAVPRPDAGF